MDWLLQLDTTLFRFINLTLQTAWLDAVIPFFESKKNLWLAAPLVVFLLIKGGLRGRIFILLLAMSVAVTDGIICRNLKSAVARPRPYVVISDTHRLVKANKHHVSMPSSHTANWFTGVAVAFIFWRRSLWLMLPLALVVGFGRIYGGVHYPGDVLAGALIGATTGALVVWGMEKLWATLGRKYFPLAWARMPSLISPDRNLIPALAQANPSGLP